MDIKDKRKKIYRAEKELKSAIFLMESINIKIEPTSKKTMKDLYSELKSKVLA